MVAMVLTFFPKFTTLCGSGMGGKVYWSEPHDVTGFGSLAAETLFAAGITGTTVSGQLQESSDLVTWTDIGSAMAPSAGGIASEVISQPARYVRMKMTVAGGVGTMAALWARGVARKR